MSITSIICGIILLLMLAAILMTPSGEKRTQHSCYFSGVRVELGAPGGRKIGAQECSGAPEYTYAVKTEHPAHVLQSVKICAAHVGSLSELAAALSDGTQSYWLVPDSN